ncbi:3-oxoacyl-ACP synthase [Crocinitomicaceae bacterium]|jgi:transcription elongation GreA/GreB family factor|nr:3-oxoacyl-ACP synthase [Crocinitomicaceae bacterium]
MDKKSIIDRLNEIVLERINESVTEINSINDSKANETKSSAGDKYETGMAMLQMEEQKANVQLAKAKELQKTLSMIDPTEKQDSAELGSLVETLNGNYFISIGLGQIEIGGKSIFVLSIASPVGLQMKGKKAGDVFQFNGNTIEIIKVH